MMKIEHIAMYVQDLEKTRDFFVKYFAAKSNAMYHNPNTDFKSYFLSFDDGARLEIMQKPGVEVQRTRCGQDLSMWQSVSEAKNR